MLFEGDHDDVSTLKDLLSKATSKTKSNLATTIVHIGAVVHHQSDAANDPVYSKPHRKSAICSHSGDNKRAKAYRLSLIFIIFCIWLFLGTFRLISALALSFAIFIQSLAQGQNTHSPTL
ncbi:hypothetical protein KDM87_14565 [Undibacterium sp. FT147W]|uniref:Uncharacterized protein n=1 Tax=Undibacterium rivi TaxID=2828729 RepID=A0ABS5H4Q0_9BURK|nr:hypothetical protein [Undibacterium rivi]MBR7793818.1 hypothetical protein [Undibacterium rivi]